MPLLIATGLGRARTITPMITVTLLLHHNKDRSSAALVYRTARQTVEQMTDQWFAKYPAAKLSGVCGDDPR